jgi:ketosteroid isomerase-like protein
VYHGLVTRIVRKQFERINQHDVDALVKPWSPQVSFTLAGDHALGGTRHTTEAGRAWFALLFKLFPDLRFEIHSVAVSGKPRNTVVMVEWTERATLPDGQPYVNEGVHVIRLQSGKVVRTNIYLDTQKLDEALRKLQAQGITEAGEPPIEG